jgi:hypothetical protein
MHESNLARHQRGGVSKSKSNRAEIFRDSLLFLDDLVTKFRDCQRIIQGVADGSKNCCSRIMIELDVLRVEIQK